MFDIPSYISKMRIPKDTPNSLVENGKLNFGTFKEPFENLNMIDLKKPYGYPMPKFVRNLRMKDWEAIEISLDEGVLASDIYCVGPIAYNAIIFYEYKTEKIYRWTTIFNPYKQHRHTTLLDSEMYCKSGKSYNHFVNTYKDKSACYHAQAVNSSNGYIEINLELEDISEPCNVCIPIGKNGAGVYTEKNFFKATGTIKFNGKEIKTNQNTMAIIDDHKAFYPFNMHYYWLTGLGVQDINGEQSPLAFNLCRNQSNNQEENNENIIWLKDKTYLLPPVDFEIHKNYWLVKDEHDTVNVKVTLAKNNFRMFIPLGLFKMDYRIPFGKLSGYLRDYDGNKYDVSSLGCMGEDVSYRI